ncbi:MAG: exodeoxyribonuclease VII small subunit [Flavobacteriales bacterium]|jgi:exodeoxyribonuclease VII small subunit|nr:exodeoxyribonuclease VII small subunit [Flavobacteriales bacterium]MBK9512969.1 exodeoxyribonuclease VII small subunit [Flavobacteriales bacterium]MBP7448893.1 exodeoxyribonuclease VII small subunit [Flavobacteriales bacterium]HOZ40942.1 exodeoxyribonuclease VII small subunit [Flavobacteriales bacterium]
MSEPRTTYEKAYEELEAIMQELQEDKVSVDQLTTKVKRAAELITFCNDMLRSTEAEVNKIVKKLGL